MRKCPQDGIKVFGKGRKEREVGISPEMRKLLWKYLAQYRRPASPTIREVFLNARGQPLTPHGVERLLQRMKEQAGIEGGRISAHTFRHTFARMYLERGGEVYNQGGEPPATIRIKNGSVAIRDPGLRGIMLLPVFDTHEESRIKDTAGL